LNQYLTGDRPGRLLGLVFCLYAVPVAAVTVYVWRVTPTATDWTWVYRLGLPVALVTIIVGAVRPRIGHTAQMLFPVAVMAAVRLADFVQDWFLTPSTVEPTSLLTRLTLGLFGWWFAATAITHIAILERWIVGILTRTDRCANASTCPLHVRIG